MSRRYRRADRVADLIHREICYLLLRKVKDPRLRKLTITAVEVSGDLRNATVFYTTMNRSKKVVERGLLSARPMMRREMGHHLDLKYVPDLHFRYDPSLDRAERIEAILEVIRNESDTGV